MNDPTTEYAVSSADEWCCESGPDTRFFSADELHLCDVGSICAAIRTHAELLSTTGTTDWVSITIHVPTDDWAGYTDDSADHDRGVRVTPATSTVYCVAPTEYAALIGALRLYVDSYTGTHISDDRAELIALMGRIESGVR